MYRLSTHDGVLHNDVAHHEVARLRYRYCYRKICVVVVGVVLIEVSAAVGTCNDIHLAIEWQRHNERCRVAIAAAGSKRELAFCRAANLLVCRFVCVVIGQEDLVGPCFAVDIHIAVVGYGVCNLRGLTADYIANDFGIAHHKVGGGNAAYRYLFDEDVVVHVHVRVVAGGVGNGYEVANWLGSECYVDSEIHVVAVLSVKLLVVID